MADIDPGDPQDTVSATVEGSVAASSAHQAAREHTAGVLMDLPEVPANVVPAEGSGLYPYSGDEPVA